MFIAIYEDDEMVPSVSWGGSMRQFRQLNYLHEIIHNFMSLQNTQTYPKHIFYCTDFDLILITFFIQFHSQKLGRTTSFM